MVNRLRRWYELEVLGEPRRPGEPPPRLLARVGWLLGFAFLGWCAYEVARRWP